MEDRDLPVGDGCFAECPLVGYAPGGVHAFVCGSRIDKKTVRGPIQGCCIVMY